MKITWQLAALILSVVPAGWSVAQQSPEFDRDVAPILATRCLDCHNSADKKGNLDLSRADSAKAGGDSGAVLVAGKPDDSFLWQRIDAEEMPPKKPLPAKEREVLKSWIASGAKWGTSPIDPYRFTTASRAGYDWWSLQKLVRPKEPGVTNQESGVNSHNAIDAFIFAKLGEKGLTPSPLADKRTLIRRVTFDLTGLPPTPEESDAFLRDKSPEAYDRLVKRLLDSPHYGERWARHWLDVAHFGESDGFEYDKMRPNAWRYRDWVIDALNRDMPYDEFARMQIAGDVLLAPDPRGTIATGFLVAGAHDSLLPKGEVMQAIMRQDELEDIVGIVSQTFLGLTVHCARCHDHKFDPVRQVEYYRLASALAGVKRGDRPIPPAQLPPELEQRQRQLAGDLAALEEPVRTDILNQRQAAAEKRPSPPRPLARWQFDGDAQDELGPLHGKLHEGAELKDGGLVVSGQRAFVATELLHQDVKEKTLEAWVKLSNLQQRSGGVIGIQSPDGEVFDAIVFGEKDPGQWLAGSNFFRRTQSFEGPPETEADSRTVHIAIVYAADGTITAYRDGAVYGRSYKSDGPVTFKKGEAQVIFGIRHFPAGGNKHVAGVIERAGLYDRALTAEEVAASAGTVSTYISEEEFSRRLSPDDRDRRRSLQQQLGAVSEQISRLREAKVFAVTPQEPPQSHLLIRGNPQQKGEVVNPGGLAAIASALGDFGLAPDAPDAERRKRLAQWIATENNPLFARTIVNRLWHYHFGRGLVETPNDLGFNGGVPVHRELLDWLACELVERRFSLKELHRQIVLSATYQQASLPRPECLAVDADSALYWRYRPRRLEAESVRDAMLSVSGLLNPAVGGPSFQDFRPYMYKGSQFYEPQDPVGLEFHRRSIYRMWARGGKNPLLDTFDCPDPSTTTPKRGSTTTPLQALSLLNNSFTLRMADALAERLRKESPGDEQAQIERAFVLICGRPSLPDELAASQALVREHGLMPFCRVLFSSNRFLYVH
ncbi:MAG TPA: DUF1553 domain-containing protein [Pirellulaceae bacterium]|nr:DUF1553 domain-containing protein [Pirellulaceae bacterium]